MANNYDELVKSLRACSDDGEGGVDCEQCMFKDKIIEEESYSDYTRCVDAMCLAAADAIEELLHAAKKMHTWIFLNSYDEQAAYDDCGLSDEMNAALGYGGAFEIKVNDDV